MTLPSTMPSPPRALAFDAYGTLFDVYSVAHRAEGMFPGQGQPLALLWRDKQIEYTRLISLSDPDQARGSRHYMRFQDVTARALDYAMARLGLKADEQARQDLLSEYDRLQVFPDVAGLLDTLKQRGIPMVILSNGNPDMLERVVRHAGLERFFQALLSVDAVRHFKTMPAAYQLAVDHFALPPEQIMLVSCNAWDVMGAAWFGMSTYWVNRQGLPPETIGPSPNATGPDLRGLTGLLPPP